MSCATHTHTPAQKSSTNFILYPFVIQTCSTNWLGHGHGYEWHSSLKTSLSAQRQKPRMICKGRRQGFRAARQARCG